MTQEEKQLLLKDLCARIPYHTLVQLNPGAYNKPETCLLCGVDGEEVYLNVDSDPFRVDNIKPYLRPMSSMTKEEENEYDAFFNTDYGYMDASKVFDVSDWMYAHHFDYRGLIEKGLALEAPPEMYNKEESEKGSEVPIPKTVDEAVKTLVKIVSEEDRDYFLKNGAISMHSSLGRWIRNEWGLWTDSELKNELKKKGFEHPDDMSNYIIEEFIKYWNNKI